MDVSKSSAANALVLSRFRIRTGGIVWMCAMQFFIAQIVVQSAWTTPFSLSENFISDLGNTACGIYNGLYVCSPWHAWMNVSFSMQGVIILIGAVLTRPLIQREPARSIIFILFVLTGLGMIGVGLFPEDVNNDGHVISAGVQFVTGNLAMIVVGQVRDPAKLSPKWFAASTVLGIAGLTATLLFVKGFGLGLGVGGMERVAAYTVPVWLIATGILLITKLSRAAETAVHTNYENL